MYIIINIIIYKRDINNKIICNRESIKYYLTGRHQSSLYAISLVYWNNNNRKHDASVTIK